MRQPWAWAIIHGGKDVENRFRNIAGDYRGPVAIHGGLSYDEDAVVWAGGQPFAVDDDGSHREPRGAIIGVVDLVGVHKDLVGGRPEAHCSPWAEDGVHHLVLANPRPLADPIPFRGALGLRRLDDATTARVLEAIA